MSPEIDFVLKAVGCVTLLVASLVGLDVGVEWLRTTGHAERRILLAVGAVSALVLSCAFLGWPVRLRGIASVLVDGTAIILVCVAGIAVLGVMAGVLMLGCAAAARSFTAALRSQDRAGLIHRLRPSSVGSVASLAEDGNMEHTHSPQRGRAVRVVALAVEAVVVIGAVWLLWPVLSGGHAPADGAVANGLGFAWHLVSGWGLFMLGALALAGLAVASERIGRYLRRHGR